MAEANEREIFFFGKKRKHNADGEFKIGRLTLRVYPKLDGQWYAILTGYDGQVEILGPVERSQAAALKKLEKRVDGLFKAAPSTRTTMPERTTISVKALDALKGGVRERARVQVENDRLRGEAVLLEKQRRELWMLLDHIDTLDDECRDRDDAFRNFTRKHQKRRFDVWRPESDTEVTSTQARIGNWVSETLGPEAEQDAQERSLRTAEEVIELAQACGVSREVLHRLVDYVFERPVGDPAQEISGVLITLYSTANALGISADEALEAELQRIQRPEVIERVRRRQAEKQQALVGDLEKEQHMEDVLKLGAVDAESVRENERLNDVVNRKRAGKPVALSADVLTKYDWMIKYWPARSIDILVKRLNGTPAQYVITNHPTSGTALFAELKALHKGHEEAEYELRFLDSNERSFRGMGRIVLPGGQPRAEHRPPRASYDGMRADIRDHVPLREDVRSGLKTLLVQARHIWGDDTKHTLDEIVVRLMVGVGDLARNSRDRIPEPGLEPLRSNPKPADLKKELGNVLFSTIRWIDDLGLDPLECLDLAIGAQERFAKSGRPR